MPIYKVKWNARFMHSRSKNWAALHIFLFIVAALFSWGALSKANAETYYLGVLAPQGEVAAQNRWQPWLDEINHQLSDDTVILVPLVLENWQQQIQAKQFALVLGPQVQFIKMNTTKWRWLATLQAGTTKSELSASVTDNAQGLGYKNLSTQPFEGQKHENQPSATVVLAKEFNRLYESDSLSEPSAMEEVASALWVAANSDIHRLSDLQQRRIAAVDNDAFGGYLLGAHLLQQNGLMSNHYQMQFVGYPIEQTLHALSKGQVDAAIAPLCLMEEMARQGKINAKQYRLIHPVAIASNCQSSTVIYPNWTLAATEQAPATLIRQINQTLFSVKKEASNPKPRWLPPESSMDAERILYDMNQHPAQKQLGAHLVDWIKSHRLWVGMLVFVIIISTINYGWMSWLAWRRQQKIVKQNSLIRNYDQQLRQSERFAVIGEMSGSIAHEINQPLATIQNYAQGLLIRSQQENLSKKAVDIAPNAPSEKGATDNAATENALQQIVNETERVAAVVTNIRSWAGKSQADEVKVDIAVTYKQCTLLLGEKATGIHFWLASDYQYLTLPNLLLDQLMMNGLLNATQQGATNIMLRCQAVEENGQQYLALHVSDDAGGFDQAKLMVRKSQIKASHQQVTQSTKVNGLGLGLMICQRLCQSVGGMMQLHNIDAQREIDDICDMQKSPQRRFKGSLSGEIQNDKIQNSKSPLMQIHANYQLLNIVGAQVSFYLPLHVTNTDE